MAIPAAIARRCPLEILLAKPEWGTKRACQSCGSKFYDFGRTPIVCPNCGAVFDLEVLTRSRRPRSAPRAAAVAAAVVDDEEAAPGVAASDDDTDAEEGAGADETAAEDDGESGDDDDDESLIEDASELSDDDEVEDVIEGEIDDDEQR